MIALSRSDQQDHNDFPVALWISEIAFMKAAEKLEILVRTGKVKASALAMQGSPWPKWAGGAGQNGAPRSCVGAPQTPKYLVLKESKNHKCPKITIIYLYFSTLLQFYQLFLRKYELLMQI